MKPLILQCVLGLLGFGVLTILLSAQVHFRIGSRHLKVTLFGICIRRILLTDVKDISKRDPGGFAERWYNTFHPNHRMLVIKRSSGWRKNFVITPTHRYVFLADLQNAIERAKKRENSQAEVTAH